MEEEVKGLILEAESALEENRYEKEDLIAQLIRISGMLNVVFQNNPNLEAAISYFQNIITYYAEESELEYQIYASASNYLSNILEKDEIDEEILDDIDSLFEYLEDLFMSRTISTATIIKHYDSILAIGILTSKNYFITSFVDRIDEQKKLELLSIVPKIKED